jgi:Calcineurin-like phosphoesterase
MQRAVWIAGFAGLVVFVPLPGGPLRAEDLGTVRLAAVGDMSPASRKITSDDQVAAAITAAGVDFVVAAGDLAYPDGSAAAFAGRYNEAYGGLASITLPVAGNHEWLTANASGYLDYWVSKGVDPDADGTAGVTPWYQRELGPGWVYLGLDSECAKVGGCSRTSAQYLWLQDTLKALGDGQCAVVVWHKPRWTQGEHVSFKNIDPIWKLLAADPRVGLVVNAHNHQYERTAPLNALGASDPSGLVEVVAGTGGAPLDPASPPAPFDAARISGKFGWTEILLGPGSWQVQFRDLVGGAVLDSTSGSCPR